MKKLKLMAPAGTLNSAKLQIEAGADEIYVGLSTEKINNRVFNSRPNTINGIKCQASSEGELKEIVKFAHDNNVKINFTANPRYLVKRYQKEFLTYVEKGINCGVDAVIGGGLDTIIALLELDIQLPIYAGSNSNIRNDAGIKMLEMLGVSRVILEYNISIEEIEEICFKRNKIEIEIFGHRGRGLICSRCCLRHFQNSEAPCKWGCDVKIGNREIKNYPFFDFSLDCSICVLPQVINSGVDVIKIEGRCEDPNYISKVTETYRLVTDKLYEGMYIEDIKKELACNLPWWDKWVNMYCKRNSCKFINPNVTKFYI